MVKFMFKKLLLSLFLLFSQFSHANPLSQALETEFTVNVQSSCFFESPLFVGNFGTISSGEVGLTGVEIALVCSNNLPYSIKPINDQVTKVGGYGENLILKAYKNSAYSDQLSLTNNITNTGVGLQQRMVIYFKLTGKGKDFGNGNGVVEKFDFSNSPFNYPIQIVY